MNPFHLLIDGQLVGSTQVLHVIDPATEQVVAECPGGTPELANSAIAAAKRAFPAWRDTPYAARAEVLRTVARVIDENAEELSRLITAEQGKPRAAADFETVMAAAVCRYVASVTLDTEVLEDDASHRVLRRHVPLGVVAGIVAWNFPLVMAVYKMAPALLAGNSFLLKPSPTTPLSALRLGELLKDVVPPGVLSVISDGGDIGPLLTRHPDIAKISFTGSTVTGRSVMRNAADSLKRLTLELGGNDAAIVLDDVDVASIAPKLFALAFLNSGQTCMAIKRIFVQAAVYEEVCTALAKLANEAIVGNGLDPKTQFGPLQNRKQFETISRLLDLAPRYGKVIAGGTVERPGFYVRPTIVRDIEEGNPLVDEEVFGPVRPILKFTTVNEAVERANQSPYGLGGSVWTADSVKGAEIASRLECGSAWVNQHFAVAPQIPFGGAKQSGLGVEFSRDGLLEYTNSQVINIAKT
jgi:acyl-CoA reductase-like NAD-dependent aldehyde dehydrogenase